MNNTEQLASDLDAVLGTDDEEIGQLAQALTEVTRIKSAAEAEQKRLKDEITNFLDRTGQEAAVAGGRRLGFTTRKYYGVNQGENPAEYDTHLAQMRDWIAEVAPEANIPASTNIGKAVNAYLDSNPDAAIPDFVKVTERKSLTNRQA